MEYKNCSATPARVCVRSLSLSHSLSPSPILLHSLSPPLVASWPLLLFLPPLSFCLSVVLYSLPLSLFLVPFPSPSKLPFVLSLSLVVAPPGNPWADMLRLRCSLLLNAHCFVKPSLQQQFWLQVFRPCPLQETAGPVGL